MPNKKKEADLVISGGTILTLGPKNIIEEGMVAIQDGDIVGLGKINELKNSFRAKERLDARDCLIMPGLINSHTHASMVCFRGLADDLPLKEWLTNYIFPAESRMDENLVYRGAMLACAEMIRSGTTTFCDMYLFEDMVARAAKEAGMRAVVGEVLYDAFDSPNGKSPEANIEYGEWLIEKWKGDTLITPAVEPHATYTCSPDFLLKTKALSEKHGVSLIIHLSESKDEVEGIKKQYGKTPVYHLESLGLLDSNLIADHCVCLSNGEIDTLARYGVKVAHNPESNMKLAAGVAPVPEMISRGIVVGLGTDGPASNNNLDMFQEMDMAAKLQKVFKADPAVMNAKEVVEMATIKGAELLGLQDQIGSLEEGKKADLIVIDLNSPHLIPLYNIYSHLVYAVSGSDVRDTVINGKLVMKNRNLLTLDEEEVMAKVNEIAKGIKREFAG